MHCERNQIVYEFSREFLELRWVRYLLERLTACTLTQVKQVIHLFTVQDWIAVDTSAMCLFFVVFLARDRKSNNVSESVSISNGRVFPTACSR